MADRQHRTIDISNANQVRSLLFENLVEKNGDAIVITSTLGQIELWNPAAEKIFGYSRQHALANKISLLFDSETLLQFKNVIHTTDETTAVEVSAKCADGTLIPVSVIVSEIRDHDPKVIAMSYIIRDLRVTIQQSEALRQKIEAMESFTYSVSHDLRAPLRRIINYAEILEEDHFASMNEEAQRIVTRMSKNTQKMTELIDDLLAFSRLSQLPISKSHIDMHALVHTLVDEQKDSPEGKRFNFTIKKLHPVLADRSLLTHALKCLLSNAIKYSEPQENPSVEIGSEETPHEIRYYFKDNGVGFDMLYVHKLFGVFQRLHNPKAFEGNGMGLAAVHQIITRHHGKVWAEGKVDEGATFWFSLPRI
jgi:PAS domain S-box-containing protein